MSRTDDIVNVAGHRLSTGGMEEVLAAHPDVAECAVLGIKDDLKGEVPCGFIVLKAGVNRPPAEIEKEIVALVREKIGPVAAFKLAITVARLPKTRSGKILRGTIKKIADGEPWTMPATIEDPKVLDEIGEVLKGRAGPRGPSLRGNKHNSSCPGLPRLDPGIHHSSKNAFISMDCRVRPGNDEGDQRNPSMQRYSARSYIALFLLAPLLAGCLERGHPAMVNAC